MAQQLCSILTKIFPSDIITIILLHSDNALIIELQDYFPKLLKHIMLNGNELKLINVNNYKYKQL